MGNVPMRRQHHISHNASGPNKVSSVSKLAVLLGNFTAAVWHCEREDDGLTTGSGGKTPGQKK